MITVGTKVAIMPGADYAGRFVGHVGVVRIKSVSVLMDAQIPIANTVYSGLRSSVWQSFPILGFW